MQRCGRFTRRRQEAVWLLALAGSVALSFFLFGQKSEKIDTYVERPGEWRAIGLEEADLTLPLVSPFEIASLNRHAGDGRMREDIYTFDGVKGYARTSRMIVGTFPESVAKSFGSPADFKAYATKLGLPKGGKLNTDRLSPVSSGQFHAQRDLARGFVTRPASRALRDDNCFFARAAYLLVDLEAVERSPDSVDTLVEVLLCGNLPPQRNLEYMLARVRKVEDRDAFRQELAQR